MNIQKLNRAVSAAIGKVFKMKTKHKIILGAATAFTATATGVAIAKTNQAKKQERSLKSLLIEDAVKRAAAATRRDINIEEAMENSQKPFVLPSAARKNLGMTELDELTDTFVMQPEDVTCDTTIFYLHGSDFWGNPSRVHYAFLKKLVSKTGAKLVMPVYPKAPAHTATEIQQMILDRYLYLVNEKEIPGEQIVFMGDAAGGGLALAILQKLRYLALPLPRQAILISPWLDITNSNPEIEALTKIDSVLNVERLAVKGAHYAGDLELTHPSVSPIYGDLNGLPKITVIVGSREIFCADAVKLEKMAQEQQLDIEVIVYKNQMHFFPALPIPEAEDVMAIIASELYGVEEVELLPDEAEEAEDPAEDEEANEAEAEIAEAADEVVADEAADETPVTE